MGGLVAPCEAWERFEPQWSEALHSAGLNEPFHMREYAHSTGQFADWKGEEGRRRRLLASLVRAITETKATPIGAVVSLDAFASLTPTQQHRLGGPYYAAFQQVTRGAALEAFYEHPDEKVAVVYARNREYGTDAGLAENLFYSIKTKTDFGKRLGAYASSVPEDLPPLQAADLIAYELCHDLENQIKRPQLRMRYALKRLLRLSEIPCPQILFLDQEMMLQRLQEGTVSEDEAVSRAMQERVRWAIERGEWEPPDDNG